MPNTNFNAYVMITKHNLASFLSFHVTHSTVMVGMGGVKFGIIILVYSP